MGLFTQSMSATVGRAAQSLRHVFKNSSSGTSFFLYPPPRWLAHLTQVSHGRQETLIKPRGSFQRHYNLLMLELPVFWVGQANFQSMPSVWSVRFYSSADWLGLRRLLVRPSAGGSWWECFEPTAFAHLPEEKDCDGPR